MIFSTANTLSTTYKIEIYMDFINRSCDIRMQNIFVTFEGEGRGRGSGEEAWTGEAEWVMGRVRA
jgi:hypothetical protein